MLERVIDGFYWVVLKHPAWVLAGVLVLLAAAAYQAQYFELDASADSLLLQDSEALETYRAIRERYGSQPFLFVTFNPRTPLFEHQALQTLRQLRDELAAIDSVASITSILNVPLIRGPGVSFSSLQDGAPTLSGPRISPEQARRQLLHSPLYNDLIINDDATITAMLVRLQSLPTVEELRAKRNRLMQRMEAGELDAEGRRALARIQRRLDQGEDRLHASWERTVEAIRDVLGEYRDSAEIHLGGVPMIAVDMVDFVANDIRTFGIAVTLFIIVLLALTFRRIRWVVVPTVICAAVVLAMFGWLGFMRWPVTVVSANFVSLTLIITLSLIVHLIVHYREVRADEPDLGQHALLERTLRRKFKPSFFTSLTTAIAFTSLLYAGGVQPVMAFGKIMLCAVVASFVLSVVLFPSLLASLRPETPPKPRRLSTVRMNGAIANRILRWPLTTVVVFVVLVAVGVSGSLRLTVENSFINYFHEDTAIYQGLALIDQELGGTTPLDVIIEAPQSFLESSDSGWNLAQQLGISTGTSPTSGYWYNPRQLKRITRIHEYIESLEATGKVLSIGTAWEMLMQINNGEPLAPYELAILYKRLPKELKQRLIAPYMSADGNEIRFSIRVKATNPNLQRDRLIERIQTQISKRFDIAPEQITVSGLLVLYNNVLQSLFDAQIKSVAMVVVAITIMFGLLYRSIRMALVGPLPTIVAAVLVLGTMGWIGLPLDIMTITIGSIIVGIGVDDTIHYVDRFQKEVWAGADPATAIQNTHREVGPGIVYTSIIIALGFAILMLSNFMPTVYFGQLIALAMFVALISNLTLLPVLLRAARPFARGRQPPEARVSE